MDVVSEDCDESGVEEEEAEEEEENKFSPLLSVSVEDDVGGVVMDIVEGKEEEEEDSEELEEVIEIEVDDDAIDAVVTVDTEADVVALMPAILEGVTVVGVYVVPFREDVNSTVVEEGPEVEDDWNLNEVEVVEDGLVGAVVVVVVVDLVIVVRFIFGVVSKGIEKVVVKVEVEEVIVAVVAAVAVV